MTALAPCVWLDDDVERAARHYAGILPDARVTGVSHYPANFDNPAGKPRGSVLTVEMTLAGCPFTLLSGGPQFAPNPTISFFVFTPSEAEADRIAGALGDGGTYLMEVGAYPWSPRYAWVQDRYGVSWQVMHEPGRTRAEIAPCLMFTGAVHGRAEEALALYADVFPGGEVAMIDRYTADEGPEGTVKHGRLSLDGQQLAAMDSHLSHGVAFSEGVSLQVLCEDQDEVDRFWERLSEGGEAGQCGWLKDRFGVSWQVVPTALSDIMTRDPADPGYERAFQALLEMGKLDTGRLLAAARGDGPS